MMIYFIQQGDSDLIKIGTSKNVVKRFKQLQTASPYPLLILGVMEGDKALERELHLLFKPYRINREWFRISSEISIYIAKNCDFEDIPVIKTRKNN